MSEKSEFSDRSTKGQRFISLPLYHISEHFHTPCDKFHGPVSIYSSHGGENVKKIFSLTAVLCLVFSLTTCARMEKPEPDYLRMMCQAAQQGDIQAGREAEALYRLQAAEKGECVRIGFDELYLLSRAIHYKYGHYRYSDELRMCAGEVILNRMASPEYPDSMEAVILQAIQEPGTDLQSFEKCSCPSQACVAVACRLLDGERMLEPEVVLETHSPGKNVYAMFCDDLLGNTYFFRSEHPELYTDKSRPPA